MLCGAVAFRHEMIETVSLGPGAHQGNFSSPRLDRKSVGHHRLHPKAPQSTVQVCTGTTNSYRQTQLSEIGRGSHMIAVSASQHPEFRIQGSRVKVYRVSDSQGHRQPAQGPTRIPQIPNTRAECHLPMAPHTPRASH